MIVQDDLEMLREIRHLAAPGMRRAPEAGHQQQLLAERTQRLHGHGLAVEVGAAPTVGADEPAQVTFAVVRDGLLVEPAQRQPAKPASR